MMWCTRAYLAYLLLPTHRNKESVYLCFHVVCLIRTDSDCMMASLYVAIRI